jgi:hypothetical protein
MVGSTRSLFRECLQPRQNMTVLENFNVPVSFPREGGEHNGGGFARTAGDYDGHVTQFLAECTCNPTVAENQPSRSAPTKKNYPPPSCTNSPDNSAEEIYVTGVFP